jgi:hypothetical protein
VAELCLQNRSHGQFMLVGSAQFMPVVTASLDEVAAGNRSPTVFRYRNFSRRRWIVVVQRCRPVVEILIEESECHLFNQVQIMKGNSWAVISLPGHQQRLVRKTAVAHPWGFQHHVIAAPRAILKLLIHAREETLPLCLIHAHGSAISLYE